MLLFSQVMTPISSAETQSFQFQVLESINGELFATEGLSTGITIRTLP